GEISANMWQRFQNRIGSGAAETASAELVELDDARRQRLVDAVTANEQLPDSVRTRLLQALEQPQVPADMVKRIESRMSETS
ncbi:MAG: hypothetical protein AAF499_07115, partial [Pseudomonadota bacterium]